VKVLGSGQFGEVQLMTLDEEVNAQRLVAVKTLLDPVRSGIGDVVVRHAWERGGGSISLQGSGRFASLIAFPF
jgi:hypothetical protein